MKELVNRINLSKYKTKKLKIYYKLFFTSLVVLTIFGCEEEDDALNYAPPFSNMEFCFERFEDEEIPFKIIDIDANNYSLIRSMCMTIYDNGTWESLINNTQVVDGVSENKMIERKGTYTRGDGMLNMVNDNDDRGTLEWYIWGTPSSDQIPYRINFTDNEGNLLIAFIKVDQ